MQRTTTKIIVCCGLVAVLGCGGAQSSSGRATGQYLPALEDEWLPELVRFVRFGETTPDDVRPRFTAENLYVTEDFDTTLGGERELVYRARGANEGIPFGTVNVTRRQDGSGYVGELGHDYGNVRFYFARFGSDATRRLFRLEIGQRPDGAPSLCDASRPVLESPESQQGCPEGAVYRPKQDESEYIACLGSHDGELALIVRCQEARALGSTEVGPGLNMWVAVPRSTPAAK